MTGWYVRRLEIPPEWADDAAVLRFGAVMSSCLVYLDGTPVGGHEGGYLPFEVDLTAHVRAGAAHDLADSRPQPVRRVRPAAGLQRARGDRRRRVAARRGAHGGPRRQADLVLVDQRARATRDPRASTPGAPRDARHPPRPGGRPGERPLVGGRPGGRGRRTRGRRPDLDRGHGSGRPARGELDPGRRLAGRRGNGRPRDRRSGGMGPGNPGALPRSGTPRRRGRRHRGPPDGDVRHARRGHARRARDAQRATGVPARRARPGLLPGHALDRAVAGVPR